jgi:hypothetical protein
MLWTFFVLGNLIAIFLLLFGLHFKKYEFAMAGAFLFLVIGIAVFSGGLGIPSGWVVS